MHTMPCRNQPVLPCFISPEVPRCSLIDYFFQASKSDGWDTEPFTLVVDEKTGRLIGRGSTDDKGPVLGWLNVLEAHKALGLELPVNMRFCFEGMEESGSNGLDDLIKAEAAKGADGWFGGVDCVCISDNFWLNTRTPCLTYGLRGIVYFKLTVSGPARDLHSGGFGRVVHEPMTDLIQLMAKLVAPDGMILVPGVEELVSAADAEERYVLTGRPPVMRHVLTSRPVRSTRSSTTLSRTSRTLWAPQLPSRTIRRP